VRSDVVSIAVEVTGTRADPHGTANSLGWLYCPRSQTFSPRRRAARQRLSVAVCEDLQSCNLGGLALLCRRGNVPGGTGAPVLCGHLGRDSRRSPIEGVSCSFVARIAAELKNIERSVCLRALALPAEVSVNSFTRLFRAVEEANSPGCSFILLEPLERAPSWRAAVDDAASPSSDAPPSATAAADPSLAILARCTAGVRSTKALPGIEICGGRGEGAAESGSC